MGRRLLEQTLPEEYRENNRIWDAKTANELLSRLAREYPEKYEEVTFKLLRISKEAQGSRGGVSPSIRHVRESKVWQGYRDRIKKEIQTIYSDPGLTDRQKNEILIRRLSDLSPKVVKEVVSEADAADNPFAWIVRSGTKGKPVNVSNLIGSPMLFSDARGRVIPVPILRGYGKGLSPSEYWAASYGTRKGLVDGKLMVAKTGFFGKQLTQITHRSVVTDEDDPENLQDESRGLPAETADDDNIGALLARSAGGYKRNTILTAKVLRDLKRQGIPKILVRSPVVGGPQDGSVYARDVGIREQGRLLVRGENPGIAAAQALSEPISQSMLSCLHEDTLVRMADFSTKKIKDIEAGDRVMGVSMRKVTASLSGVSVPRGEALPVRVVRKFDQGLQECQEYVFKKPCSGETVSVISTAEHKYWLRVTDVSGRLNRERPRQGIYPIGGKREQVRIEALSVGKVTGAEGSLFPQDDGTDGQDFVLQEVKPSGLLPCYDIEVDNKSHLFLLANGISVSNSKHSAGVVSAGAGAIGGFDAMNQFVQVPQDSVNWAAHAPEDGTVRSIAAAPQGGHYIQIGEASVYVPSGQEIQVKEGESVEAGDRLSGGLPNPAIVTEHKGIGEGRRYFMQEMVKLLKNSGVPVHRRNVELIARGLVNHVELDEEMDTYVPGDRVPYTMLEKFYRPREDAKTMQAKQAAGKYLERPVLHYTIGTKIRPSVVRDLQEFGLDKEILVHDSPPPFRARLVRGMAIASQDPDWLASMQGSGIKARTLTAVHRGHTSDPFGTSFVSGIVGDPDFASEKTKGKIQSPVYRLREMEENRRKVPENLFDLDDEEDE
jgi:hypothetical protein